MVWDTGTWEQLGDGQAGCADGRLKFRLGGHKLRWAWVLVRMKRRGEKQDPWLLIKEKDEFAQPGEDVSVQSGRSMAEIADGKQSVEAAGMPVFVRPQLATLAAEPSGGDDWLFEIKHDGYRCQLRIEDGRCTVRTRGSHDWTDRFGDIAAQAARLPLSSALIDAEAVVLGERGVSSFSLLRQALERGGGGILCYAFDLLSLDGTDLRDLPLVERKRRLAAVLQGPELMRYSDHLSGTASELLSHACRLGAEGLIAKRADQPYRSGRGTAWLKVKCRARE
jgi:bifunctional non-homologous end joining protein LigD